MKRIIIVIILMQSLNFVHGQVGEYEVTFDGWAEGATNHNCGYAYVQLEFANSSNNYKAFEFNFLEYSPRVYYRAGSAETTSRFSANQRLKSLRFWSERKVYDTCRGTRAYNDGRVYSNSSNNFLECFDFDFEFGQFIDSRYHTGLWNSKFNVKIYPILTINPPGEANSFPVEDDIVLTSHTGFKTSEYNWKYSFDGYNWVDMYAFNGAASIKLNAQEIGDFDASLNHGRTIYFKQSACGYDSDIVKYKIRRSAPHITSVNTTNTTCYDEKDGSVKINFDRGLEPNERLSITIEDLDKIEGYVDGVPTYKIVSSSSNVVLASDNSYTFNKDIEKGLGKGRFRVILAGGGTIAYNGDKWNTYTESPTHQATFTINKPSPVEFTATHTNAWCYGGSDGTIIIKAKGGKILEKYKYLLRKQGDESPVLESDWVEFENLSTFTGTFPNVVYEATEVITGKPAGNYTLQIKDANNCIAKEIKKVGNVIELGREIVKEIIITEPENPLEIVFVDEKQPTAFGFSDGRIRAQITGGTSLPNGKYNFTWTHESGRKWTTFTDFVHTTDGWYLTLENAIQGTYSLTVTDANYTDADTKKGCMIVNASYTLNEPFKLNVAIEETNVISCNRKNAYDDPFSDGELTAIASGGVPFSPLIQGKYAYKYTWKKKDRSGVYQIIPNETGDTLRNQEAGEYAVNIEDANGIIIGNYRNNTLTTPTDVTYNLEEPELLKIQYTKQNVFCYQGADGAINTTITGGTGTYTTQWNTGATSENISNLEAGIYTVMVTDGRGCQVQETIEIEQPKTPIEVHYNFFEPTFAGATNGWIQATITGGTPLNDGAYTYGWTDASGNDLNAQVTAQINSNNYILTLNGIGEGTYKLTVQDKNYPSAIDDINCSIVKSEYTIKDPEALQVAMKLVKPISCNNSNAYGDPSSDGILEAVAGGGVMLQPNENNGLPYYYTWKKETSPGVWTILTSQTTNIATGLNGGNYAVNIKDANGVVLGVYKDNVLVTPTDVTYHLEEPTVLELSFEKQDVHCYEGSDGWAKTIIKGGIAPYIIEWENKSDDVLISNLTKGAYTVAVTDSRGCQATGTVLISQPEKPISINFTAFATPTVGGVADGWVNAEIEGGTVFPNGSYTYYWQNETGEILNTQTQTDIVDGKFQIQLNNISKGIYYLTIQDANYITATSKEGCTYVEKEFVLYDPIEAIIAIEKPISCNQNNTFSNPYGDGSLRATITGGLPFSVGQDYKYTWKKKDGSGIYQDIHQNSSIVTSLSAGAYALNVEDSRGVVIGVYDSLELTSATDVLYTFREPELIALSLSATEISCDAGNDGTATVAISGGVPPYDIQWSNGQSTPKATNLIAGNHLVFVTDARGCEAAGNITIEQPGGLSIKVNTKNPTCYNSSDGAISLDIIGGVPPYTYSWSSGEQTTNLTGLHEGRYIFSLTDANGCKVFEEVKLENPAPITIDLGADKTLCKGQEYVLDASIDVPNVTYEWTSENGFVSDEALITVTEEGTYTVTVTSSLGCIGTDSVAIIYSDRQIAAEFLMSSQAYINEDVVVFHTSNPAPESFEWVFSEGVTIIEEKENTVVMRFAEKGTYKVGLLTNVGDCVQELYKNIVIEENTELPNLGDTKTPFIEAFNISPSPNTGNFKTKVSLAEPSAISLRFFNTQGEFIKQHKPIEVLEEYDIPFNMNLASGMYILVLETAKQTQVKRMIVK
ncbi:T9SS type A sorting domain-containing protein [Tenacibaculum maritimum]|uniref:T9SS type A sorting domain-containing protein n=1 Tax=Tenacibaculum maritimum TaxID=107401 RepID=UPI0009FEB3C5|nr:T9SS type A sorting domain-containing protein [Tenacibaculum maritimum]